MSNLETPQATSCVRKQPLSPTQCSPMPGTTTSAPFAHRHSTSFSLSPTQFPTSSQSIPRVCFLTVTTSRDGRLRAVTTKSRADSVQTVSKNSTPRQKPETRGFSRAGRVVGCNGLDARRVMGKLVCCTGISGEELMRVELVVRGMRTTTKGMMGSVSGRERIYTLVWPC